MHTPTCHAPTTPVHTPHTLQRLITTLQYLRKECDERGATILYATHIFDGLDEWATHLGHMTGGKLNKVAPLDQYEDFVKFNQGDSTSPLLDAIDSWLRAERVTQQAERALRKDEEAAKDLKLSTAKTKHGTSADPFARNRQYN